MSKVKINNKIINTNSTTLLYKANIFLLFTEVRNPRQKQNARESVKEALLLDIKRTGLPCIANANLFIELFTQDMLYSLVQDQVNALFAYHFKEFIT